MEAWRAGKKPKSTPTTVEHNTPAVTAPAVNTIRASLTKAV
jgi:hypothetical protein